jgi:hypothetical protein
MTKNILEYNYFINESIDSDTATENIIEVVKDGMGWIDPEYAIEMFTSLTGIPEEDPRVDTMLADLADLDLLYYSDDSVSNKKGKKVEFGKPEFKEYPHQSSGESTPMSPTHESVLTNIINFDDFN